jgi:hypothetical protein
MNADEVEVRYFLASAMRSEQRRFAAPRDAAKRETPSAECAKPGGKRSSRLLKKSWFDPLVLRDAMLRIAPQHEGINGIN